MATNRPFAYNPTHTSVAGTYNIGDLAVGVTEQNYNTNPGGLIWWGGPDEEQGYVIAVPISGNTQPTPLTNNRLYLSSTYKAVDISLSDSGQTATQVFSYQQSVLGETLISSEKMMFSVQFNSTNPSVGIGGRFIGVGRTSMNYQGPFGGYPGNDGLSSGFSDDGKLYYNGSVLETDLPTWGDGDIIDIAVAGGFGLWWIRVTGGYWNGDISADPATNDGGLNFEPGDVYPVLCPYIYGSMEILNISKYDIPASFLFLGNTLASVKFLGTKVYPNPFSNSTFIGLAEGYFNQSFTSATEASTWLTTNGYWNSYTGILVPTNGLTLYVDAGINLSYSGSGNQWYDLSENNNTGTLQNSPTYSSSDGGVLTFNGSNQYISFSSPTNIPIGNSNYTISVWFNTNTLGGNGFVGWGNWGSGNQVNAFRLGGSNLLNYWWGNDLAAAASISINTWYNAVARFDGTNRQIWVNNVMIGQDTPGSGHNVPNANNLRIGSTNNGEYFNGKISNIEIYDRALSDSEIDDIFNNIKSRFGL